MRLFRPCARAASVHAVDYRALHARGVKGLIFDLDNTLARWRAGPPREEVRALLARLQREGFRLAVVSNGRLSQRPEVVEFFRQLGIPLVYPARKPLPAGLRRALRALGLPARAVALIGDQLLTDVLGGNLMGLYTILVEPLDRGRESPLTKLNRGLERLLGRGG